MLRDLEGSPRVFVHLRNDSSKPVRTFDHPVGWNWAVGSDHEYVLDVCQSATTPPLSAGVYDVKIGLHDAQTGRYWPLDTKGERRGHGYRLARISVPAAGGRLPIFQFGSGWGPAEDAGDRQIIVRRPFGAAAPINVKEIASGGTILMTVRAEDPKGTIALSSDCGVVSTATISGAGAHDLRIVVGHPTDACEIRLALAGSSRATLERIGWMARS